MLKTARQRRVQGLYVNEDFSEETRHTRKLLVQLMREKKAQGLPAFLQYKRLVVKNCDGKENWYEVKTGEIIVTKKTFDEPVPQRPDRS